MRRKGKIGRRKVFSKVKNVNVESPKKRSKLLDFWSGAQEWRVASPPIAISCFTFLTFVTFVTYVTFVTNVTYDSFHSLHPRSKFHPLHPRSNFHSLHPRLKTKCRKSFDSEELPLGQFFGVKTKNASEKGGSLSNMKIISCVRFELDFRGQIFTRRRSIDVAMWLMREEIWTEKIFKDDAGYFLRIT